MYEGHTELLFCAWCYSHVKMPCPVLSVALQQALSQEFHILLHVSWAKCFFRSVFCFRWYLIILCRRNSHCIEMFFFWHAQLFGITEIWILKWFCSPISRASLISRWTTCMQNQQCCSGSKKTFQIGETVSLSLLMQVEPKGRTVFS